MARRRRDREMDKAAMRKAFLILLSLLATALIFPPLFLAVALALDRLGFAGLANRIEQTLFGNTPGHAYIEDAVPLVPGWLTATIAVLIAALLLGGCLCACFRYRHGSKTVAVFTLSVLPVYAYLAHDEAPEEFRPETLQPSFGSPRIPREVVLEASNYPTYGRVKGWPKVAFEFHKVPPSTEWLLNNAEQIQNRWNQLQPVRAWAARLDEYPTFDDYVGKITDPVLSFQTLRQMVMVGQEYALLCGAQNNPSAASATVGQILRLSRHLENGSRAVVTLMMGEAMEKVALHTLQTLYERDPGSRELYCAALETAPPLSPWEDLERTLRNEIASDSISAGATYLEDDTLKDKAVKIIYRLFFNPNASKRIYQRYGEGVLASAQRHDFDSIKRMDENPNHPSHQHVFKNPAGQYHVLKRLPALEKVAKYIDEVSTLRTDTSATLGVTSSAL